MASEGRYFWAQPSALTRIPMGGIHAGERPPLQGPGPACRLGVRDSGFCRLPHCAQPWAGFYAALPPSGICSWGRVGVEASTPSTPSLCSWGNPDPWPFDRITVALVSLLGRGLGCQPRLSRAEDAPTSSPRGSRRHCPGGVAVSRRRPLTLALSGLGAPWLCACPPHGPVPLWGLPLSWPAGQRDSPWASSQEPPPPRLCTSLAPPTLLLIPQPAWPTPTATGQLVLLLDSEKRQTTLFTEEACRRGSQWPSWGDRGPLLGK